jgi:hypothetical protein
MAAAANPTPKLKEHAAAADPLAALQDELKKQGEEVARLRQHAAQQPVVQMQPAQQPAGQPPSKEDIEKIFWKDPLPMVDAIARRAAWETEQRVHASGADTQRQVARDKAREADPEVFDKYALEVERMVAQVAPQFQGNLNVWQNALNMVRGQHVDEIFAMKLEKKGDQVNEPSRSQGNDGPAKPSPRQPTPPKATPLTDDQKEVARGLHLSEEEYRRGVDRYANQDKHWPKHVTFSSEQRRRDAVAANAAAKRAATNK